MHFGPREGRRSLEEVAVGRIEVVLFREPKYHPVVLELASDLQLAEPALALLQALLEHEHCGRSTGLGHFVSGEGIVRVARTRAQGQKGEFLGFGRNWLLDHHLGVFLLSLQVAIQILLDILQLDRHLFFKLLVHILQALDLSLQMLIFLEEPPSVLLALGRTPLQGEGVL